MPINICNEFVCRGTLPGGRSVVFQLQDDFSFRLSHVFLPNPNGTVAEFSSASVNYDMLSV